MSDLRETRLEKARTLESLGRAPYALGFAPSHRTAELQQAHADLANGEERADLVAVAGRVMTRRVMGKLAFFTIADESGPIQLFIEKATLLAAHPDEPEAFAQITSLVDGGDWIGVHGSLRRTDRTTCVRETTDSVSRRGRKTSSSTGWPGCRLSWVRNLAPSGLSSWVTQGRPTPSDRSLACAAKQARYRGTARRSSACG